MHFNEVGQQTSFPYQKGPIALGVIVGMFSAILLWLAYLRLDWQFGNLAAAFAIFALSAIVAAVAARIANGISRRSLARKRDERLAIQEAEKHRKLEEARKAGII